MVEILKALNRLWRSPREHVTDEVLLSLLDGELPGAQARRVQKHLESCWTCRTRRGEMEVAIGRFVNYRQHATHPHMPPPGHRRDAFIARLDSLIASKQRSKPNPISAMRLWAFSPAAMTAAVLCLLIFASVVFIDLRQRGVPAPAAAELLARAEAWDAGPPSSMPSAGVLYQKIEIRSGGKRLQRVIYRDMSNQRKARPIRSSGDGSPVEKQMESGGAYWEDPLSVKDFRRWRERQPVFHDKVTRSGDLLLVLTTTVPDGPVTSESLTVQANDFRPTKRTIEVRGSAPIEIAELSYAVLGWNEVNSSLFEAAAEPPQLRIPQHHDAALLAVLPTTAELDRAELDARMVLDNLHADEGERIDIVRTEREIQVRGIVDSEERKQEIAAGLEPLKNVKAEVQDAADLQSETTASSNLQPVHVQAINPAESPLERYFEAQHSQAASLENTSQFLLDATFRVKHNADQLQDVKAKFGSLSSFSGERSEESAEVKKLVESYSKRLSIALDDESSTLRQFGFADTEAASGPAPPSVDLGSEVQRNNLLCRELVVAGGESTRNAPDIVAEIRTSILNLRFALMQHGPETGK